MRSDRAFAYAGVGLGLAASLGANVLHVMDQPGPSAWSVAGAAFWPLALLVSSEVLARKRWASRHARIAGVVGVLTVAGVAAWISYGHVHGLLLSWGEPPLAAALGPLAIDGLMVVSSLALVAQDAPDPAPVAAAPEPQPVPVPVTAPVLAAPSGPVAVPSPKPRRPRATGGRTDDQLAEQLIAEGMANVSQRAAAAHLRVSQARAGRVLGLARERREAS